MPSSSLPWLMSMPVDILGCFLPELTSGDLDADGLSGGRRVGVPDDRNPPSVRDLELRLDIEVGDDRLESHRIIEPKVPPSPSDT